ncbi:MAG: hypothetical protein WB239_01615 [Acidimicrobiia bacterium]
MDREDILDGWDEPEPLIDQELSVLDLDEMVRARPETDLYPTDMQEDEGDVDTEDLDEDSPASPDDFVPRDDPNPDGSEFDSALVEFVDLFNARDLDELGAMMAPEVEAEFLGEDGRDGVVDGLNDLLLRYPSLLLTRGDLGKQPIAVAWVFDPDDKRYDTLGYFMLSLDNADMVDGLEYFDELPESEDLVVETPEDIELPEWEEWTAYDES